LGHLGGSVDQASDLSSGHDLRVPGSSPIAGLPTQWGVGFSLSLSLSPAPTCVLALSLLSNK